MFQDAHDLIRYPLALDGLPGLRKSQIGALHAISSHFTLYDRSATVVLPTGAGKTAVLMLTPYLLRAERALVITQSRFVRDQIARDFKTLGTLKAAGALPSDLEPPRALENSRVVASDAAWNALREYDAVIATPNTVSPAYAAIPLPPEDLFDLVLIDEAHHSPARTWSALLRAFPRAKSVLFTATPFRRDRKEIKGKHVYTYPIQRAFEDGIYGEMRYLPVEVEPGAAADVELARKTEQVFQEDQEAGRSHVVMVRAESRPKADQLAQVYQKETELRLEVIHSGHSPRTVDRIVKRLRSGELDGVICVNMLGEGFDLPNLKIAALHAPHRSLAVTLQFFGRFARVNGERLGDATFLAAPSEIGEDLGELFKDSEAWGKHIRMVGQARIGAEIETREFLDEFESDERVGDGSALEDLSLYSFTLFNHVKVFNVHGEVDLHAEPTLSGFKTERAWVNDPRSTAAFVVREETRPTWATTPGLDRIEHHLFLVYYDEKSKLLFICATYREESTYREVANIYVRGHVQPLSLNRINRVLRSFQGLELFHVGMRNRAAGTVAESYRQLAGAGVHHAIGKDDGSLYHRGHVFGRGKTPYGPTTVGLSSLSKVWRLEQTKIPALVKWCESLARDIENSAPFQTGIALDYLGAGNDIDAFPAEEILAADWHEITYRTPPQLRFEEAGAALGRISLLDVEIQADRASTNAEGTTVALIHSDRATRLRFVLNPFPAFIYVDDAQPRWQVERGRRPIDLATYLTDHLLRFHLADGSLVQGCEQYPPGDGDLLFELDQMEAVDWLAEGVEPSREFGDCSPRRSVHSWLRDRLVAGDAAIVFYDHRSGECADFLTVTVDEQGRANIGLYHCKGAGGEPSGNRVDDLYDVCGQVTKSVQWRIKKRLVDHVRARLRTGSSFAKGDLTLFNDLVQADPRYEFPLEIYAVQPGVSVEKLAPKLSLLLSTTSRGIVSVGCQRLRVICSE